jgi:hypothetical protein
LPGKLHLADRQKIRYVFLGDGVIIYDSQDLCRGKNLTAEE